MSVRLMSEIFESTTLGPTERLVMLSLADHAGDDGRCYPSISRLCQRTGLSERAVQTNIRKLVEQGFIHIVQGGGKGGSNLYFLSSTPAADAPPQEMHPAGNAPRSRCTPAADAPAPPQQMRVTPAADAPKPSRTIIEPSEGPPLVPPDGSDLGTTTNQKRARASALPPDWVPSDKNISDAFDRNFTEEEIHEQAGAFRDYHLARGTTFKDWDAGWRTWLGNVRKFGRSASASHARNRGPHHALAQGFQRAAARERG